MASPLSPAPTPIRPQDISATFAKGLAVLKAFDGQNRALGFSDVARLCRIDRATARRLVLTLAHLGYLRRSGKTYELTPKVLVFAGGYLQGRQFGKLIQPVLERHARGLDEKISLAVLDEGKAIIVAQAAADATRISFGLTVGSHLPLTPTAIGRAILAASAPALTQEILQDSAAQPHLPAQIDTIRQTGIAIVRDTFEPGVTGIAAPIVSPASHGYAVGMSRPSAALSSERLANATAMLQECANDLASIL